ncbi:hypothetical protein [Larkinella rosea]|uniref:Uncharacterized protein n=1 Tax=Larkinella rosea TaxID=2025312 RepID=A0A3P1BMD3_9BACT|nr:hypothetical protein [Larkinella rosea]RRB02053.1 hypothetical protein EHT25_16310 [Larkinella rosea]
MYNISRLEDILEDARGMLSDHQGRLRRNPTSHFYKSLVASSKARVEEYTTLLIQEKERRGKEIVELRLIGPKANFGSLPANLFSLVTEYFEEMLVQAGRFIRYGHHNKGATGQTRKQMNIQLSQISSGSTRLFFTIDSHPDMYGNSLTEDCLYKTFDVLQIQKTDDISDRISQYGKGGVKNMNKLLRGLINADLEAEINWFAPNDKQVYWEGNKEKLFQLQTTLESMAQAEPEEKPFYGTIITESIKGPGKFEVKLWPAGTISGTVPKAVMGQLLSLHVGETCKGVVYEFINENRLTGDVRRSYQLKSIEAAEIPPGTAFNQLSLFN